jgi:hypothetical protein
MNRTRDPEGWANPNVRRFDRVVMTTTTAERTAQAMTIPELISAIAGVQALISAGVESPFCPFVTNEHLGIAYARLSETMARMATRMANEL